MDTPQNLVYLFSLASLFCLGLNFTAEDLKLLLRDKRALGRALLANAVLLPFLIWMLLTTANVAFTTTGSPLQALGKWANPVGEQQYVLLLLALASGNLLAPALATVALARVPYTYGMSVIMTLVSVVVVPLGLYVLRLSPDVESARATATPVVLDTATIGSVLMYLVGFQLLPFLVGMAVRARYAAIAAAVRPFMSTMANIVFLLIIVGLLAPSMLSIKITRVNDKPLIDMSGLIDYAPILVGGLVLAGAALLIGYLMAGADKGMARGLGVATGLRNVTAVLVLVYSGTLGDQLVSGPATAATLVLIAYLVQLVLVTIVAGEWGRKPIVTAAAIIAPTPGAVVPSGSGTTPQTVR